MHLIMVIVVGVLVLMLNSDYQKFGIQAYGTMATNTYDHDELRAVNGTATATGTGTGTGTDTIHAFNTETGTNSNNNSNSINDRHSNGRSSRSRNRIHSFTRSRVSLNRKNSNAANIQYNAEAFIGRRRQRQKQQQQQLQEQQIKQRQTAGTITTHLNLPLALETATAAATATATATEREREREREKETAKAKANVAAITAAKRKTTRIGTSSMPTSVTLTPTNRINTQPSYSTQHPLTTRTKTNEQHKREHQQHQQHQQQQQQQQSAFVYKAALPPLLEGNNNKSNNKDDNNNYNYNYYSNSKGNNSNNNNNNKNNNNNNNNNKQQFMNVNNNNNFNDNTNKLQNESDLGKKVTGSSVATSISVVLNGDEPQFTDALGHRVPKPQPSIQVASPIDLLNPDRYEFYTFDENGELVKRLMTMKEIQSIVANDDGEGPTYIHPSTDILHEPDPEHKVQDIVKNVQNVLNKEVATNKNTTQSNVKNVLDTPDVSASWSMILPAIFGNTGDDIFPKQKPQQIIMTPESELIESSTSLSRTTATTPTVTASSELASSSSLEKLNKKKPLDDKHQTSINSTPTTKVTPQVVQEELDPNESVYTGQQQYQNMATNMKNFDNYAQFNIYPMYSNQSEEIIDSDIIMLDEKGPLLITSTTRAPQRKKKPTTQISVTSTISSTSSISSTSTKYTQPNMKNKLKKKPSTTAIPVPSRTTGHTVLPTSKPFINKYDANNFDTTVAINKRKNKPTNAYIIAHHQENLAEKPQIMEMDLLKRPSESSINVSHKPSTIISVIKRKKKPTHQPLTQTISTTITTTPATIKEQLDERKNQSLVDENSMRPLNNLELENANEPLHITSNIFHGIFKPRPTTVKPIITITTTPTPTTTVYAPVPTESQTVPPASINGQSLVVLEGYPGLTSSPLKSSSIAATTTSKTNINLKYSSTENSIVELSAITNYGNEDTNPSLYKEDDSAEQIQQDLHTLESFDKIMQSLTQSLTFANKFDEQSTAKPTKYNSAENLGQLEGIADKRKKPVNLKETDILITRLNSNKTLEEGAIKDNLKLSLTTVQPFTINEEGSTLPIMYSTNPQNVTTPPNMYETMFNESEGTSVVLITAKPQYSSSMYKDEEHTSIYGTMTEEPEIATIDPSNDTMLFNHIETTTIYDMESSDEDSFDVAGNIETQRPIFNYNKETDTTNISGIELDVRTTTDDSVTTQAQTTESPVMVMDLVPHLNMDVIKPIDKITMSDFQTQAATVASTLLDGFHTYSPDISVDKINDTNIDYKDLLTDVLQQITEDDVDDQYNYDRVSNFAKLNKTFLPESTKEFVKRPDLLHSYASINKLAEDKKKDDLIDDTINTTLKYKVQIDAILKEYLNETLQENELSIKKVNEKASETKSEDFLLPFKGEFSTELEESTEDIPINKIKTNVDDVTLSDMNELTNLIDRTTEMDYIKEEKLDDIKFSDLIKKPQMEYIKNLDREALFESYDSKDSSINDSTEKHKTYNESEEDEQSSKYENNSETVTTEFSITDWSIEGEEIGLSESMTTDKDANTEKENNDSSSLYMEDTKTTSEFLESYTESFEKLFNEFEKHNHKDSVSSATYSQHQYNNNNIRLKEEATSFQDTYTHKNIWKEESTFSNDTFIQNNNERNEDQINKKNNDWTEGKAPVKHEFSHSTESLKEGTSSNDQYTPNNEWTNEETSLQDQHTQTSTWKDDYGLKEIEITTEYSTIETNEYNDINEKLKNVPKVNHHINTTIFEGDPYVKLGETTQKSFTIQSSTVPFSKPLSLYLKNFSNNTHDHLKAEDKVPELDKENGQFLTLDLNNEKILSINVTNRFKPTKKFATSLGNNRPLKPVSYFNKQSSYGLQQNTWGDSWYNKPAVNLQTQPSENRYAMPQLQLQPQTQTQQTRPINRPPQLNNLMAPSTQATRPPVKLDPSPLYSKGLEASLFQMDKDVLEFTALCNELAFSYWKAITLEKISSARSLIISPFALTSMLSMVFLGARGTTSGEMNDMLRLDDMVTFNPHLIFKNITHSVERTKDNNIATAAFVRELFSDRSNGKILQFFKERAQQIYSGHVEEVNFNVVNDIIRRRTNLLIKRHTMGKVFEYLRTNSIWLNGPLATITANLFQTNCSAGSTVEKDGEMFFQVHPTIRQRRLVPIPAVVFRKAFIAGYEPTLDATAAAFGTIRNTVSIIYVMPGHQNSASPADNLNRLEKDLMETAISNQTWSKLLMSLMERPGLEVQLPRFSHRSFINATTGLQKLGLSGLFRSDYADLGGLTGSTKRDIYLSDMIQVNTFSTCGEEKIADHHHIEMYPAPPLRKRNKNVDPLIIQNYNNETNINNNADDEILDSSEVIIDFGSLVHDTPLARGFYDDLLNPKYLELPLPLRPRQARVPDAPRLRFDKPFLYFVRHNPTGMILFIGRFNPRLLP